MSEQEKKLKVLIADMLQYLEEHQDEGPPGEGWQSRKLVDVINRAYDVIGVAGRCNEPET